MKPRKIILSCLSTTLAFSMTGLSSCSLSAEIKEKNDITISYASSANGAVDDSQASKSVKKGTLWKNIEQPKYQADTGYKFLGWYANDKRITDNFVFDSNVAVIAHFGLNYKTISYSTTEGGTIDDSKATKLVASGTKWMEIEQPKYYENDGFKFAGWYIGNNLVTDSYTIRSNVTFVASFVKNTCDITFDTDGNGKVDFDHKSITKGSKWCEIDKPATTPNDGFKFVGWYKGDEKIDPNDDFEIFENASFIARFEINLCTVSFIAGANGTISDDYITQNVEIGTMWSSIVNKPTPKAENGYSFDGWYRDSVKIEPGADFEINSNIFITAIFKENTCKVSFIPSGGGSVDSEHSTQTVDVGTQWINIEKPEAIPDDDYVFVGWYKNDKLIEKDEDFTITTDLNIVAHFEKSICTIEWTSGGNGTVSSTHASKTVNIRTKWEKVVKATTEPQSDEYEWDGWYINNNKVDDEYEINTNITVVARFKKISCTVSFGASEGGEVSSEHSQQKVRQSVTKWSEIPKPEVIPNDGFKFVAWYKDDKKINDGDDFVFDGDTSIVAHFANNQCKLDFTPGENGTMSGPLVSQIIDIGEKWSKVQKPEPIPDQGYQNDGWYKGGEKIEDGDDFEITSDTTITARFKIIEKPLTISYGKTAGGTIDDSNATKQVQSETPWKTITLPIVNHDQNYVFDGWYIGDEKIDEQSFRITTDIVVVAHFKTTDCTIDFSTDGNAEIYQYSLESVPYNTLWKNIEKPDFKNVAADYVFVGWYNGDELLDDEYAIQTSFTAVAVFKYNITCPITWISGGHGKVNYNSNTCTCVAPGTTIINIYHHDRDSVPTGTPDDGYGGFDPINGWRLTNGNYASDYPITSNTIFVAHFEKIDRSRPITYVSAGGGTLDDSKATKDVGNGMYWSWITPAIPTPDTGYEFDGWYLSDGVTHPDGKFFASSVTFIAKFKIVKYQVEFYSDNALYSSQTVKKDFKAIEPSAPPQKEGWTFEGWYSNTADTEPFNFDTAITSNKKLYAKWKEIPKVKEYTFKFVGKNCTLFHSATYTQKIKEGKTNIQFTIFPDEQYILPESISISGVTLVGNTLTIAKMDKDYTVNINAVIWEAMIIDGTHAHYIKSLEKSHITGDGTDLYFVCDDGTQYNRYNFNLPIFLNPNLTSIGNCFLRYCVPFNYPLELPTGLQSIGNEFLYKCETFNKPINIPSTVKKIGSSFLCGCTNFNSSVSMPSKFDSIGDSFMEGCSKFNQPIVAAYYRGDDWYETVPNSYLKNCKAFDKTISIAEGIYKIGNDFLYGCSKYNTSLNLPNRILEIGDNFMFNNIVFDKSLTLPTNIETIGDQFMGMCLNFNSTLIVRPSGSSSMLSIGDHFMEWCTHFNQNIEFSMCTYIGGYFLSHFENFQKTVDLHQSTEVLDYTGEGGKWTFAGYSSSTAVYAHFFYVYVGQHASFYKTHFPPIQSDPIRRAAYFESQPS